MPQQSDLISKFVKLSIRRGSSLASLSKSPDHLRIVVDTFRATARDPLDPDEEDAKKFLAEAGNWITDTAQNLLEVSASSIEQIVRFPLSELTSAVEAFREEIRQKRKHKALSREEEVRLSRIDRSRDEYFMREALVEAEKAHQAGEVPVGAVVVDKEGKIIGRGHNLVVCSGAIIGARLARLVYGAKDQKAGAAESVFKLFDEKRVNHHTDVTAGVLEEDCLRILQSFFVELRKSRGKTNG